MNHEKHEKTGKGVVPRLRFPEFRDKGEWKSNLIEELATISKGRGISKADVAEDGIKPCIRYAELYTFYGEVINEVRSKTSISSSELILSQAEDVILPASGETRSDIATAACVTREGVALGGDLNILRSVLHGPFFSYLLNSPLRYKIAQVAQGDTVAHLYPGQISKIPIAYPTLSEQQKIAHCLGSLDGLIAAKGRKLAALRDHKRGLMQQLFPQPGETHPRRRFPEFGNDHSGFRLIGTFAKVTTGNKDTQNKVDDGEYPFFVRSQNVERIDSFSHDCEAVLTSGDGVGVGENYHYINGKFEFHQRVYCIYDFAQSVSGQFFFHYFSTHFKRRVKEMSAKNSVDSVRMAMITEMPIWMPPHAEQKRIADFLTALDTQIAAHAAKIETLKQHKRGLMQHLFPAPEVS